MTSSNQNQPLLKGISNTHLVFYALGFITAWFPKPLLLVSLMVVGGVAFIVLKNNESSAAPPALRHNDVPVPPVHKSNRSPSHASAKRPESITELKHPSVDVGKENRLDKLNDQKNGDDHGRVDILRGMHVEKKRLVLGESIDKGYAYRPYG